MYTNSFTRFFLCCWTVFLYILCHCVLCLYPQLIALNLYAKSTITIYREKNAALSRVEWCAWSFCQLMILCFRMLSLYPIQLYVTFKQALTLYAISTGWKDAHLSVELKWCTSSFCQLMCNPGWKSAFALVTGGSITLRLCLQTGYTQYDKYDKVILLEIFPSNLVGGLLLFITFYGDTSIILVFILSHVFAQRTSEMFMLNTNHRSGISEYQFTTNLIRPITFSNTLFYNKRLSASQNKVIASFSFECVPRFKKIFLLISFATSSDTQHCNSLTAVSFTE